MRQTDFPRGTTEIWWAKESLYNRLRWNNEAPSGKNYNSTLALYVKINSKCIQCYTGSLNYNNFSTLKKKKIGKWGWKGSAVARALTTHPENPGSIPSTHIRPVAPAPGDPKRDYFLRQMIETNSLPRKTQGWKTQKTSPGMDAVPPQSCVDPLAPPPTPDYHTMWKNTMWG